MKQTMIIVTVLILSLLLAFPLFSVAAPGGKEGEVSTIQFDSRNSIPDMRIPVFGRKDRTARKKPASSAPADFVCGLPSVPDAASPITFTARVRITGNEPHTRAMLTDTVTGKNYLVIPAETETMLYLYQGVDLEVTGRILDSGAGGGPFPADGIVNPDGWNVDKDR